MLFPDTFEPLSPQEDSEELAAEGERLLIRIGLLRWEPGKPMDTVVAPTGILHAGWVIGLRRPQ